MEMRVLADDERFGMKGVVLADYLWRDGVCWVSDKILLIEDVMRPLTAMVYADTEGLHFLISGPEDGEPGHQLYPMSPGLAFWIAERLPASMTEREFAALFPSEHM